MFNEEITLLKKLFLTITWILANNSNHLNHYSFSPIHYIFSFFFYFGNISSIHCNTYITIWNQYYCNRSLYNYYIYSIICHEASLKKNLSTWGFEHASPVLVNRHVMLSTIIHVCMMVEMKYGVSMMYTYMHDGRKHGMPVD